MPRPEEFGIDSGKVIEEISDKIGSFESRYSEDVRDIASAWNSYEGKPDPRTNKKGIPGLANTFVYETPRAVDALATTRYRMLTATDPNFEAVSQSGNVPEDILFKNQNLISRQLEFFKYKSNLRRGLTSLELMGTLFVEMPWMAFPNNTASPIMEGTGFVPRPLNQVFFSPNAIDFESADWKGTFDIVTAFNLSRLAASDPAGQVWIPENLILAARDSEDDKIPSAVKERLTGYGYQDFKGMKELALWRGPLESANGFDEYMVGVVNRKHLVRFHQPHLPFCHILAAYSNPIEQKPFGLGVYKATKLLQRMLNSNRNRIFDLITFSLYSMFKVDRFAGLDPRDAEARPWKFLMMDNIGGMEPLRPLIEAAQYGFKLEEAMRDEFQSRTGATKNLQATATEATATEASLLMDQVMRKISVDTEVLGETLLRDFLYYCHAQNRLFLDRPIRLGLSGNVEIYPEDLAYDLDFRIKVVTDKDFRPNRLKMLIQAIQIFTSIRNQLPQNFTVEPLADEMAKMFGIDPQRLRIPPPPPQPLLGSIRDNFAANIGRIALLNKEMGRPEFPIPGGSGGRPVPAGGLL